MKLLHYNEWKKSASSEDNISFKDQVKMHYEMYEFARGLETQLGNLESNIQSFYFYFQKALSIFHRFAHQLSMKKYNRHIYIVASLFLSAKDNDTFNWSAERYTKAFITQCEKKPLQYQLNVKPNDKSKDQQNEQQNGEVKEQQNGEVKDKQNGEVKDQQNGKQDNNKANDKQKYDEELVLIISQKITDAEAHILQMIGYDLNIIVPQFYFKPAVDYLKIRQGDVKQLFDITQKFLSDMFFTNACLYFEPKIIFLCAVLKASKIAKLILEDISFNQPWYSLFNASEEENPSTLTQIQELESYFDEMVKLLKN